MIPRHRKVQGLGLGLLRGLKYRLSLRCYNSEGCRLLSAMYVVVQCRM